jgi:hypothetical protein
MRAREREGDVEDSRRTTRLRQLVPQIPGYWREPSTNCRIGLTIQSGSVLEGRSDLAVCQELLASVDIDRECPFLRAQESDSGMQESDSMRRRSGVVPCT